MDVSDRRLHVQLTQEAKIAPDFSLFRAIFAFAGFVSALRCDQNRAPSIQYGETRMWTKLTGYRTLKKVLQKRQLTKTSVSRKLISFFIVHILSQSFYATAGFHLSDTAATG